MLNLILPLLLAGTLHLWNATALPQLARIQTTSLDSFVVEVPAFSEVVVPYTLHDTTATITGVTAAWTALDNVTFNAIPAQQEWLVPSTPNTGLLVANPTTTEIFVSISLHRFDGQFETQTIGIAPLSSAAFFVPILFSGDGLGTVVVSSSVALYVQAARCDGGVCVAVPAK